VKAFATDKLPGWANGRGRPQRSSRGVCRTSSSRRMGSITCGKTDVRNCAPSCLRSSGAQCANKSGRSAGHDRGKDPNRFHCALPWSALFSSIRTTTQRIPNESPISADRLRTFLCKTLLGLLPRLRPARWPIGGLQSWRHYPAVPGLILHSTRAATNLPYSIPSSNQVSHHHCGCFSHSSRSIHPSWREAGGKSRASSGISQGRGRYAEGRQVWTGWSTTDNT
jgi:hypothetical protein